MISRARRWSARVTHDSDALSLEPGVYAKRSSRAIAQSLKRCAEHSRHRSSPPLRSAISMLKFDINRRGAPLAGERRKILERVKMDLRALFGRNATVRHSGSAE